MLYFPLATLEEICLQVKENLALLFFVLKFEFAHWGAKKAFKYAENLKMKEEKG